MNAMRLNGWTLAVILFACTTIPALAHDGCNIRYRLTDLGDLGGGFSFSEDMNDRGQVVGYSITSDGEPHAFLSSPAGGMSDLMPESDFSVAFGVNHRGQVVLNRTAASGEGEAIVWSPHRPVRILPTLGGERTSALGINNHGQVVGWSELTNGDQHAFLWTPGDDNLRDLGTLGGAQSAASDINESGEVVGHSNLSTGPEHAFRWSSRTGRMQDLGTLDGGFSDAEDINERGQVVGRVAEGGTSHAVSWSRRAEIRDLGTLGGSSSFAAGINNRRQVVGWSTTPPEPGFLDGPQHAFLWSPRCGMQDLNDLLVRETQVTLTLASAINNRGQIAADGELGNFTHAYRLTPCRKMTRAQPHRRQALSNSPDASLRSHSPALVLGEDQAILRHPGLQRLQAAVQRPPATRTRTRPLPPDLRLERRWRLIQDLRAVLPARRRRMRSSERG